VRIRDVDALADAEFSMAPLIDIVFQLLIFFMVATTYSTQEKELGIELPRAESADEPALVPEEIVIQVFRDGRMRLGGQDLDRDALLAALSQAARGNPAVPVTIRGDRLVAHEKIVTVMDACGLAGLSNLAVGTLDL
jgi:biopolymer transport protein ExbD